MFQGSWSKEQLDLLGSALRIGSCSELVMPVKDAHKEHHRMNHATEGGEVMLRRGLCAQVFTEDEPDTEEKGLGRGKRFAKINWLRAGILSADKVLTVSPNYAAEIAANPQMGVELDDVLRWAALPALAGESCMNLCPDIR